MRNPGWLRFAAASLAYVPLVILFGIPILASDCGAGGDVGASCAQARRLDLVYYCLAVAILAGATFWQWRGSTKAAPYLLAGSIAPLLFTLALGALSRA